MAELLEIITQLDDTEAAIARTEQEMARHPQERSLRLVLASLEKRQENLATQFAATAASRGIDVCTYRLFDQSSARPNLRTFANTLRDFQELVTTVYDALKHGPKERLRVGVESLANTSFGFAYSFSGSLGVVLTLPNEHMLFTTDIDDAIETVFRIAHADRPAEVASFVERLGTAVVRIAYQWAQHHADAGVGADIQWRRADNLRASLLLQPQELAHLQAVIEQTSEVKDNTFTWVGVLLGGDVKTGAFHMSFEGAGDIKGRMADDLDPEGLVLKERYRATIRKLTVTKLSTGQVEETNVLLAIEPLNKPSGSEE
jgi:hypothetical protein